MNMRLEQAIEHWAGAATSEVRRARRPRSPPPASEASGGEGLGVGALSCRE